MAPAHTRAVRKRQCATIGAAATVAGATGEGDEIRAARLLTDEQRPDDPSGTLLAFQATR
jgi:hypothetical protein